MVRLILKQTLARRGRLALTAAAVALGISFVTGTLVLTDTAQRAFDDQFAAATSGTDLTVRDAVAFESGMGVEVERDPLPAELLDDVREVPGVARAEPVVRGSGLITHDGETVVPRGPSVLSSWTAPPVGPYALRSGHEPDGADQIVVDLATAREHGIQLGDRIDIQANTTDSFTVVGLAGFGDDDGLPNTTVALVELDAARALLDLGTGISEISVVADESVATTDLVERVQGVLGTGVDVSSGRDTAAASAAAAKAQLRYIEVTLLVLAGAALLIGGFLIANTFSIVVTQRTRELAMLRAAGATGRQVFASVIGEALAVGLVGSLVGLGAGVVAARGLRTLVAGAGVAVPDSGLIVTGRTLWVAVVIGIAVTLLAAVGPGRRAARVSPVVALRTSASESARPVGRVRLVTGTAAAAVAAGSLWAGMLGDGSVALLGLGGFALVSALVVLGPVVTPAVAAVVGRPLADAGVPGALARQAARRAPRRTAATVIGLALSLGLVVFAAILGSSVKAAMASSYREVVSADLVVESARGEMLGGLVPAAHRAIEDLDEVAVVSRLRYGHWKDAGVTRALTAIDPETLPEVATVSMVAGDLGDLDSGGIVVAERVATRSRLWIGDEMQMTFARSGTRPLRIVGVVADDDAQALSTDYLISLGTYARLFSERMDASLLLRVNDGVSVPQARGEVVDALEAMPTAEVRDQAAAVAGRTAMVDQVLGMVMVLLVFTVLIATLGITNTLALSIVERTREIGLLRAIGMTGSQLRRTIRAEAVLTSAVGLALGLALGLGLAVVAVGATGQGADATVDVPYLELGVVLVSAMLVGLLAGLVPARRAGRLDVLAAISEA